MQKFIMVLFFMLATASIIAEPTKITIIQIGDIHGHLTARPNLRSDCAVTSTSVVPTLNADCAGRMEGGLARMYTLIEEIKARQGKNTIVVNTGDTIQGSAEALYTYGQALVEVLNHFHFDAYAAGNWDFVYGTERFLELFVGDSAKAPWNGVAANLYYDGEPYADKTGERVLPPYMIKEIDGIKVGILGFTSDRGPKVVGKDVTKGFKMTKGHDEMPEFVKILREEEKVDLLIVISELGLANNLYLADQTPGIDAIFSADMHEITWKPVVSKNGTLVVEAGQDGTVIGEMELYVEDGKLVDHKWTLHYITDKTKPNATIAKAVKEVRKTFVTGPDFIQYVNPFNGTKLPRPIDTVVGYTKVGLHRSNFSHEDVPGVLEGTSHNFITDAFRAQANADIGVIRGFRYGTHIAPGPIKMEYLYHYIPIGPMIAKGTIKGMQLKTQLEKTARGSLHPDVTKWGGGWVFGYSGLKIVLDLDQTFPNRIQSVKVLNKKTNTYEDLDMDAEYSYAGYYYENQPNKIMNLKVTDLELVTDDFSNPLDGVEVIVQYLQSLPDKTVNPSVHRVTAVNPLPKPRYGNWEVQPLGREIE